MVKFLRLLLILLLPTLAASAQSEDFHAFKFDLLFGYASPLATSSNSASTGAGVSITFHPHYRLTNELAVGVRLETALLITSTYDAASGYYTDGSVNALNSYCLTGEYYISNGLFRPFVGVAAGLYNKTGVTATSLSDSTANATLSLGINKFGIAPTVGFEIWHFRAQADYNYLPNKDGYWGIKAGFFFGGGPKDGGGGHGSGRSRSSNREGGFRF